MNWLTSGCTNYNHDYSQFNNLFPCGKPAPYRNNDGEPRCPRCHYQTYLRSAPWKRRRHLEIRNAGFRCQRCDARGSAGQLDELHVHHLSYDHLGHERADELVVLCAECHRKEHGIAT